MYRNGMGQSSIETIVSTMTDKVVAAMLPKMKEVVASAAQAAAPAMKKVAREEILPKFGLAVVLGLAGGAAIAAAIGAHYATRRQAAPRYRRNYPVRRRRAA